MFDDKYGCMRQFPLRNFGEHQGDARLYKEADCPRLTFEQVKALIKRFDRSVKYKRVNSRRFVRCK